MKLIYYISVIISAIIFIAYMISVYGGPSAIYTIISDGFYSEDYINTSFKPPIAGLFLAINHVVAVVFWGVIILPLILPFLLKKKKVLRYKLAFGCLIILVLIVFIPKIIHLIY